MMQLQYNQDNSFVSRTGTARRARTIFPHRASTNIFARHAPTNGSLCTHWGDARVAPTIFLRRATITICFTCAGNIHPLAILRNYGECNHGFFPMIVRF